MNADYRFEECSTGNPTLDRAQEAIVDALFDLRDLMATTPHAPRVRHLLERLFQAAPHHFEAEERAMQAAAYPRAESHAASHALLLQRLRQVEEALKQVGRPLPELALYSLCSDWLWGHRSFHDRDMADFLRDRKGWGGAG